MDFINILVLFGLLINFFFALIIRFRSTRTRANSIFEFTVYAIVGWCLSMIFFRATNGSPSFFWAKMLYFFPTFIPSGFFLFGLHFPNIKIKKEIIIPVILVNILIATLTQINGAIIQNVTDPNVGEKIIQFGWAYPLYLFYVPGFFLASYLVLLKKYFKSDLLVKAQIHFILLGLFVASTVGMITNLVLPTINIFKFNWMGQFFTFIWVGGATYAIVKHKLMDIKVFATQVLIFALWILMLTKLFVVQSASDFIVNFFVFVLTVSFGLFLIRSVKREIEQNSKLKELFAKLQELDKQKNEFISMAAHELRAPLTAIKGYISMILEGDTGDIPEKARGYLADVNSINDRLVRLVNNMLNVSRIEEGRMVFQIEEDQLSRTVHTVYSEFIPEAGRKQLDYKLDIPTSIKDKVKVDADKINEVIGNLISNAIKYTESGFVIVKLLQPKKDMVRFEVSDSGPGISKEEQGKLFQKFYRIQSNVGKTTGTGLGLYISKLMIEKFGGNIGVNSEMGKGSTFWFEIPTIST